MVRILLESSTEMLVFILCKDIGHVVSYFAIQMTLEVEQRANLTHIMKKIKEQMAHE